MPELPGTVRHVRLTSYQFVDAGMVLVVLDVSVEEAEAGGTDHRAGRRGAEERRRGRLTGSVESSLAPDRKNSPCNQPR